MSMQWSTIETMPEGVPCETLSEGGLQQILIRDGNLFWTQDKSMYIYYVPKFWREI